MLAADPVESAARSALLVNGIGVQPRQVLQTAGGGPNTRALEEALAIECGARLGASCRERSGPDQRQPANMTGL